MGLFNKKPASARSEANNAKSGATTIVPSQNASHSDLEEKTRELETSVAEKSETGSVKQQDAKLATSGTESSNVQIQNEKEIVDEVTPALDEDEIIFPTGLKLALITLALCLSVFLVALDNTIIATAIPKITDRFNSLGDVGWYGSAYLLTTCSLQLFFGKLVSPTPKPGFAPRSC